MAQRKDPRSCKSQLSAWSTMIVHTVIILQLTDINGGESLADSQFRMMAEIGHTQNVTLPCSVSPATDVVDKMVEWSRADLNPRFVHVRRSGEDRLVDQNPLYKGRTWMSTDRLKTGNASLTLTKLRLSDEGTYRCFIPGLNTDLSVELVVEAKIKITKVNTGVLECKSEGWDPEPEVLWLESEQKLLSAGPKEAFRGPDGLYSLSSRLTLQKGHSNNFTCRVQQYYQHREETIHVPDDFFEDSSPSARAVIGGLIAGIMFIIVCFLIWKWRTNQRETKKSSEDEESQSGRDSRSTSSKNPEKESLLKKEEESKGGSEALMNQGKVEVHHPVDDISNHPVPITQSERQQTNDQPGREATDDICSNEKTQSGDKRPSLIQTGTHPESLDSHIETSNQSLMDSSGQQQQLKQGGEVKNDTDKKENTKNTQTTNDETPGQSPSEEEKQKTEGKNNPDVQKKDGDGESTETTNDETAEPLDKRVSPPNPAEEETKEGQDNQEKDSRPNSSTELSYPEKNEARTSSLEAKKSSEDGEPQSGKEDSRSTSSKTPEKESLLKKEEECKGGSEALMNQGKVEVHHPVDDISNHPVPITQSERQQTNDQPGREATDDICSNEKTQSGDKRPSLTETGTHPESLDSHIETSNQSLMDSSGQQQQLKQGGEVKNDTDNKENTNETQTTNEETPGQSPSEEEKQKTEGKDNPDVQKKDGDGDRTETTNNETAEPLDKRVSPPNPAEEETEEGESSLEKNRPNSDTEPLDSEENGTNQELSGSKDLPNTEKTHSGHSAATDGGSKGGDQGVKDQNNVDNGKRPETDKDTSPNDQAGGGETKTGQVTQRKTPSSDTQPSHLKENGTNQEKPDSDAKGETGE